MPEAAKRSRGAPRAVRALVSAGLGCAGALGLGGAVEAEAVSATARCSEQLAQSASLRRVDSIAQAWVLPETPIVLPLPIEPTDCLTVVAESHGSIEIGVAIHSEEGELLAEGFRGPTSVASACAQARGRRYAVIHALAPTSLRATTFASSELAGALPTACAADVPAMSRSEVEVATGPTSRETRSQMRTREARELLPTAFAPLEDHRMWSPTGRAVPLSLHGHAGRPMVIEARDGHGHVSISVTTPTGRRIGADATDEGAARVFVVPETDGPLVAWIRSPDPVLVRVFEASP